MRNKTTSFTKADLIRAVEEAVGSDAERLVQAALDVITEGLRSGEEVEVRGFGNFGIRQRRSRIARNPKSGARVEVPSKRIVFFRPSRDWSKLGELK
jgi:integration host factor subunit beta